MSERFPPTNSSSPEGPSENEINEAKIKSAIDILPTKAFSAYVDVYKVKGFATQELFHKDIETFNALPAEMRGKGTYDANRPLTENIDRSMRINTPAGYPLTITLEKDGTVVLSTTLAA